MVIVGAGPKAAAIAARAAILKQGKSSAAVPDIVVLERDHVAAAWNGGAGYSSGYPSLCTAGEKDVGFPYPEFMAREGQTESIGSALFAQFSWSAFLVATGRFSNWVDYGRDHPTHREWAEYIEWVLKRSGASLPPGSKVLSIVPHDGRWLITYLRAYALRQMFADHVVLTGSGTPKALPTIGRVPKTRHFDADSFWANRDRIPTKGKLRIAVAGAGGAAGAIVAWLANRVSENDGATIESISPHGTLFPRGDGYSERRWFSDPTPWRDLKDDKVRKAILNRTEAGVISTRNKSVIDRARHIQYIRGRVEWVGFVEEGPGRKTMRYWLKDGENRPVDFFVNAIGFDVWSLLDLVDCPQVRCLMDSTEKKNYRQSAIKHLLNDFSIGEIGFDGVPPVAMPKGLHFPALADTQYGPGMSNLGSLGLMARHVLGQ
jgi:mycobactin lysine-N-oxygenase